MTTIVAIVGDTHCGSTVGLCPEAVLLPDGGEYQASNVQLWLLEKWREYWAHVGQMTNRADDLLVVWNGDELDGRLTPVQRFSSNMAVQRAAFREVRDIAYETCGRQPDEEYYTAGTPFHAGDEAEDEAEIASDRGKSVIPRLSIEVEGVLLWVQHPAWGAHRPWTVGGNAVRMADAIINQCYNKGWRTPQVVVTSHRHIVGDSGRNFQRIRVVVSPGWQLCTEHVWRSGGFMLADIGGVVLRIENGRYDLDILRYDAPETPPLRWPVCRTPVLPTGLSGRQAGRGRPAVAGRPPEEGKRQRSWLPWKKR